MKKRIIEYGIALIIGIVIGFFITVDKAFDTGYKVGYIHCDNIYHNSVPIAGAESTNLNRY